MNKKCATVTVLQPFSLTPLQWIICMRNDGYLSTMALQQKKVIRAITFSDFYAHTSPLFKSLNILKIKDLFNHKICTASTNHQ